MRGLAGYTRRYTFSKQMTVWQTRTIMAEKEFEKLQSNLDKKCNLDEFNTRLEAKLDRSAANSLINQRPSR